MHTLQQALDMEYMPAFTPALGIMLLFLAYMQQSPHIIDQIMNKVSREILLSKFKRMKAYAAEHSNKQAFRYILRNIYRE